MQFSLEIQVPMQSWKFSWPDDMSQFEYDEQNWKLVDPVAGKLTDVCGPPFVELEEDFIVGNCSLEFY